MPCIYFLWDDQTNIQEKFKLQIQTVCLLAQPVTHYRITQTFCSLMNHNFRPRKYLPTTENKVKVELANFQHGPIL